MSDVADSLREIAGWPQVAPLLTQTREACTRLRFHEALRRRIPEAAAESRVRGAHASAELDGARSDLNRVRDLVRGATGWPDHLDPGQQILRGAVQVTAQTEQLGLTDTARVLARLHLAAAAPVCSPERLGRPRPPGSSCAEFTELPPAPAQVHDRLVVVQELLAARQAPALLVAAFVHAEIALVRPFERGNGLVARAAERLVVRELGLESTGVAVPEAGHLRAGSTAYLGALSAYATGTAQGVEVWVRHCGAALLAAVADGERIADAVRRGRTT